VWLTVVAPVPDKAITSGEFVALLTTVTLPDRLPAEAGENVTVKDVDCPAARLSGKEMLLTLKPAPLSRTCEMETLEFPVLVTVKLCVELVPVVRLPKLSEADEAESCNVAAMPVPLIGTTRGEFGVLLISVMLPDAAPAEVGAKPTLNVEEPPAGMERGRVSPLEVNPVPEREAWVTLSAAVPGFLMVRVWELLTPTVTLPKLTVEGMTEICACTPVPLRVMVEGELVALLTTATLPERLPVEAGANATLKVVDCPAASVTGSVIPLVLKPAPVALICEMETLEFPVLEIVTLCAALEPTVRLPKLSDAGDTESCSVAATPVPLRGIASDEVGALLISVMLPEKVPAEAGAKPALNETAPPGAMERGTVRPDEVNPVPAREA